MIYCREKLIDIVLNDPWVQVEDRIDFEVAIQRSISAGLFSKNEWQETEEFLATGNNYSHATEKVIKALTKVLGYTDDRFLNDKTELFKSVYYSLEKGVRL